MNNSKNQLKKIRNGRRGKYDFTNFTDQELLNLINTVLRNHDTNDLTKYGCNFTYGQLRNEVIKRGGAEGFYIRNDDEEIHSNAILHKKEKDIEEIQLVIGKGPRCHRSTRELRYLIDEETYLMLQKFIQGPSRLQVSASMKCKIFNAFLKYVLELLIQRRIDGKITFYEEDEVKQGRRF